MTYHEKVQYLRSYKDKKYRLIYLVNQIEGVKGISYEENVVASKKTVLDYIEEKTRIETEMKEIRECIKNIEDVRCRYVLEYKFIKLDTLEQISVHMGYSLASVKNFYKKGINSIPK